MENMKLSEFYQKKFDSFLVHLFDLKSLEQEDVHRFRVNVKNIKSLLLLVEEVNMEAGSGLKMQKQIKNLFKYSGHLQAAQICTVLLMKEPIEIAPEVIHYLDVQKEKAAEALKNQMAKFDIPKFKKRALKIAMAIDELDLATFKNLTDHVIHDELEIVRKLLNSSHGDKYYHKIRKLLKVVKVLHQLILSNEKSAERQKAVELVNETESSLGSWHDYKVLEDYLDCMESEFVQTDLKRQIKSIRNRNAKIKLALKNNSGKLLRENYRSFES